MLETLELSQKKHGFSYNCPNLRPCLLQQCSFFVPFNMFLGFSTMNLTCQDFTSTQTSEGERHHACQTWKPWKRSGSEFKPLATLRCNLCATRVSQEVPWYLQNALGIKPKSWFSPNQVHPVFIPCASKFEPF